MTQLDPDAWDRLASLFADIVELPVHERARAIATRTVGEPQLAAELAEMVAAHESGSELSLERELFERSDAAELAPGTLIGTYRIVRPIGRGGMGEVYLADRADGAYEHQVAVKILRAGMYGRGTIARFERERRILARLDHPAVVPILDGGLLADGRPYLVLQYVDGAPITHKADADKMPVRDRLKVFVSVCRAVEFAHGRLVVHRDLKPSNILVGTDGLVRLLDFGVAKLLSADEDADGLDVTRHGAAPMTPERAAPEQLRGEPPTTATDVWALGVLLYELLAGSLPFDVTGRSVATIAANVTTREPQRLTRGLADRGTAETVASARATTPARLRRALRGDLEVIVAKALQADPERRYQNAGLLADDIEAVIERRPISARPDAWSYRAQRFVSRHRAASAAALTTALALIVLAIGTTMQSAALRTERDRVAAEATKTRATADLLVGLLGGSGPREGAPMDQVSVDDLLKRGETQVEALSEQPDVQARLWQTIATIRVDRSELAQALPIFERAVAASQGRPGTDPDRASLLLDYANLLQLMDRPADVRKWMLPLVAEQEATGQPDPDVLGRALQTLANATPSEEGVALAERSVAVLRAGGPAHEGALAGSLGALGGRVLRQRLDPQRARLIFQEALDLAERVKGPLHIDTLQSMQNLAAALPPAEAIPVYRRLIASYYERFGGGAKALAFANNNLGVALIQTRQYAEGEAALREAQTRWFQQFGPAHEQTINNLRNIARAQEIQGLFPEAEKTWVDLQSRLRQAAAPDRTLAQYLPQRAQLLRRLGRHDDAARTLEQARRILEPGAPAAGLPLLADVSLVAGLSALDRRTSAKAVTHLEAALAMRERVLPKNHPAIEEARVALGRALLAGGDPARGRTFIEAGLPAFSAWPMAHPDDVAAAKAALSGR
ncbi:MAG: protein kinase [Acidobacteria bacterium]|nr:protein kinase [Acidobacteriota bacterium]